MRIAIDCRIWNLNGAGELFQAIPFVRTMLSLSSEHSYFLVFDQNPAAEWKGFSNAQCLVLKPSAHTAATRAVWYDLRLPALLSGHQIDLFIGSAGYISLRTPIRQVLMLHDVLSGVKAPAATGWQSNWYPRRMEAMLEKAFLRVASSPAQVQSLLPSGTKYPFQYIPFSPFALAIPCTSEARKEEIKQQLTGGIEFFVCLEGWQTLDDAVELLLAFSAFKKRMQSGMKLLLIGEGPSEREWNDKLETFRYREDVILQAECSGNMDSGSIIAAAWALIHLPSGPYFQAIQLALCVGTPVITWPHEVIREMAGEAVCYCTDMPGESLAQNLMRMYKDEKMRSEWIRLGFEKARLWNMEDASKSLLQAALQ